MERARCRGVGRERRAARAVAVATRRADGTQTAHGGWRVEGEGWCAGDHLPSGGVHAHTGLHAAPALKCKVQGAARGAVSLIMVTRCCCSAAAAAGGPVCTMYETSCCLDHIIDHMLQCCSCAHELLDQAAGRTLGGRWAYMWRRVSADGVCSSIDATNRHPLAPACAERRWTTATLDMYCSHIHIMYVRIYIVTVHCVDCCRLL